MELRLPTFLLSYTCASPPIHVQNPLSQIDGISFKYSISLCIHIFIKNKASRHQKVANNLGFDQGYIVSQQES
jgi:hypothetical protein